METRRDDYLKTAISGAARMTHVERAPDNRLRPVTNQQRSACGCALSPNARNGCCPQAAAAGSNRGNRDNAGRIVGLAREAGLTALNLSLWMLVAFLLEALIARYFPTEAVAGLLGKDVPWAIPLAAVPDWGAVTTIPAMAAVWGLVKPRVFLSYLGFAIAGALIAGYAFQFATGVVGFAR
jgi:uncharacterized membrane protein YraQ (UPF0718 family)